MTTLIESDKARIGKVAFASSVGTLVEWYDYFIASFAAGIVWPLVFYSSSSPAVAVSLSIATFGSTFFTRPIGAFIFGHYGDRLGRRNMLVWSISITGISLAGITITPGYVAIGALAPILILLFRLSQGIGLGGEFGGANTWLVEHAAKSKRRSFWTGWIQMTIPFGIVLGALAFFTLLSSMGGAFMTWGWRVPFAIGAVVCAIGLFIRLKLEDSPEFTSARSQVSRIKRAPSLEVLKEFPGRIILLATLWAGSLLASNIFYMPYGLSYLGALGVSSSFALSAALYGALFGMFALMVGAVLGDIIKRKYVIIINYVIVIITSSIVFLLYNTRSPSIIILGELLMGAGFFGTSVLGAFFTESFPLNYRYSGSGLSYNIGGLFAGIGLSIVLPLITTGYGGVLKSGSAVTTFGVVVAVIGLLAALVAREDKRVRQVELQG